MKRVWGITFYVSNLKRSISFYEETLGLNKKYEYSNYAGFDCGGVEIGLIPKEKVAHGENIPSVEFLVDNVDTTYQALNKKGVKFLNEPHNKPWGGREARFIDPDGNVLEIMQINWEKYFNAATKGFKKL
ncbi:MAG: VOC family protein [Thermoproteota archaeon]|nr:VOC family protein [Thermoproteota archaeon]